MNENIRGINTNKLFIINYFDSLKDEIESEFEFYILKNGTDDLYKLERKRDKILNKIYKIKLLNLREFDLIKYDGLLNYQHQPGINYYPEDLNDQINSLLFPHYCFHVKNKWLKQVQLNKNVLLGYLVICGTYLNQQEMKIFEYVIRLIFIIQMKIIRYYIYIYIN
jgi:hypothetical protein